LQRRIFSLLFLIAGVLHFQSAQAQTPGPINVPPPLAEADGTGVLAPPTATGPNPGTYDVTRTDVGAQETIASIFATAGGKITGYRGT
jgi:hypothetical protein